MNKIYLNDMQNEVLVTGCKDNIICAGRGIGKGVLHAAITLRNIQRMPRCCIAYVSANCKRALTNTIPSMLIHLENWGYKREVHYCIGHKPAKSLNWPKPIFEPQNSDNVIYFYTGAIGHIVSQDRVGTSNSMSYDFLDIDEAKFINFERLKDETFPANRGNKAYFGMHYYHHGMLITSDMPVTKKGSWFLNYEQKCDLEAIKLIQASVLRCYELKQLILKERANNQEPSSAIKELKSLHLYLCKLRANTLLYKEYGSAYNLNVLGEAFLRDMKRDLPPLTYQTSILCRKIGILKDGFYSNLTPGHKYSATNFHYLDSIGYNFSAIKEQTCQFDDDVDKMQPLCIAFDYNSNINWLVCAQPGEDRKLRILKSFYVKYERKLVELCDDFASYYYSHPTKVVNFYYDNTALGSNYAVNDEDFRYVIVRALEKKGWRVKEIYIGKQLGQLEKYMLINRMLAGKANLTPVINEQNNEDLLLSIETAGVYNGTKDKRGEKLAETEEDKLEHRTDGSDAFDTLCIGCERLPAMNVSMFVTSSFSS